MLLLGNQAALRFVRPRGTERPVGIQVPAFDPGGAPIGQTYSECVLLLVSSVAVSHNLASDQLEAGKLGSGPAADKGCSLDCGPVTDHTVPSARDGMGSIAGECCLLVRHALSLVVVSVVDSRLATTRKSYPTALKMQIRLRAVSGWGHTPLHGTLPSIGTGVVIASACLYWWWQVCVVIGGVIATSNWFGSLFCPLNWL